jgi:hypothetical protein
MALVFAIAGLPHVFLDRIAEMWNIWYGSEQLRALPE